MELYYNAGDGDLELPNPGRVGTRIVAVGESFYGSPYYEQFVRLGMLCRFRSEYSLFRTWVTLADFGSTDAVSATGVPYRFKTNSRTSPTAGLSCYLLPKCLIHFPSDATPNDALNATYYFYMNRDVPTMVTHTCSRIEVLGTNWTYPTWAALPSDFWSLSPADQRAALLATA